MRSDREVNLLAGTHQPLGYLHPRRTGPHHQHSALGQLLRIAVRSGVHLRQSFVLGGDRRDDRALERTGGGHHTIGLDHALGGFNPEARPIGVAYHPLHFHAGADGSVELLRIGFEIVRHLFFRGEGVGIEVEFQAREAVVPGRAIGNQRIPTPGTPGFGDTVALQNQVRHAESAQVFAHRHTGLTGADYERVYCCFIVCHRCALLRFPTRIVVGGCRSHSVQRMEMTKL
ncbi:hypothetical protein D9M71_527810 [compost metagenome]